jgi:transposase-like protein
MNRDEIACKRKKFRAKRERRAVEEYLTSAESLRDLSKKYGMSKSHIWNKVTTFVSEMGAKDMKKMKKTISERHPEDAPELRVKDLEKRVKKAELKAAMYDAMITMAEKELGVCIRKK